MPPPVDGAERQAQLLASKCQIVLALKERTMRLYSNWMNDGHLLGCGRTSLPPPDFTYGFHIEDTYPIPDSKWHFIIEDALKYFIFSRRISMKVYKRMPPLVLREFAHFKWIKNYPGAIPMEFNDYDHSKYEWTASNPLCWFLMPAKVTSLDIEDKKEVCPMGLPVYRGHFGFVGPSTFRPEGCSNFNDKWEAWSNHLLSFYKPFLQSIELYGAICTTCMRFPIDRSRYIPMLSSFSPLSNSCFIPVGELGMHLIEMKEITSSPILGECYEEYLHSESELQRIWSSESGGHASN